MNRFLVFGRGSIAKRHVTNLRQLVPYCEIAMVSAGGPAGSSDGRVQSYRSIAEVESWGADAALIANESSGHLEPLLFSIASDIPIYVEKPVVTTRADLESVCAAIVENNYDKTTQVGCNLRFLPILREFRRKIVDGSIGSPVRASFQVGQWLPDWRPGRDYRESYSARRKAGGGVIMDLVHEIDMARWLLGDCKVVACQAACLSGLEIDVEDVATIELRAEDSEALVQVGLDYVSRAPLRRYCVIGTSASIEWDLQQGARIGRPADGWRRFGADVEEARIGDTYPMAMQDFLEAARSQKKSSSPLKDGLHATCLALDALEFAGVKV